MFSFIDFSRYCATQRKHPFPTYGILSATLLSKQQQLRTKHLYTASKTEFIDWHCILRNNGSRTIWALKIDTNEFESGAPNIALSHS